MSHHLVPTRFRGFQTTWHPGPFRVHHYLRVTFISGPKILLTSRISPKCALIMALMCTPSLLLCTLLTLPDLLFQSPHQQAFFYFSKVLNEDPDHWIVLFLTGVCTLISLAVPATLPETSKPIRY